MAEHTELGAPIAIAALSELNGRVPHWAYPLELRAGRILTVEQDTIDDVRQCVHVLMVTPLGARPLSPEDGVEDPTFSTGIDPELLAGTLEDQEPRARVHVEASPPEPGGGQGVVVKVALAGLGEEPA